MTNLESVLKSRGITLSTKVLIVKAMVFSVVIYGSESWTVNNAVHQRIDAKMGSIKDRNGMDLTEAEDIKKR